MRTTLGSLLFFLLVGCGSDKFTPGDAGSETGCVHELCDDFDQPGEVPGNNPPWTSKTGTLLFAMGNASKQSVEAQSMPLGSYLRWNVKTGAKGVGCAGDVWLEPTTDRDRTIALVEADVTIDAGPGTFLFGVGVNDMKGVTGGTLGPGTLSGWGASTTLVPTQKWLPFKMDAVLMGTMMMLSATIGSAMISGGLMFPFPLNSLRIDLGAASSMPAVVRWDNVTCDSR